MEVRAPQAAIQYILEKQWFLLASSSSTPYHRASQTEELLSKTCIQYWYA